MIPTEEVLHHPLKMLFLKTRSSFRNLKIQIQMSQPWKKSWPKRTRNTLWHLNHNWNLKSLSYLLLVRTPVHLKSISRSSWLTKPKSRMTPMPRKLLPRKLLLKKSKLLWKMIPPPQIPKKIAMSQLWKKSSPKRTRNTLWHLNQISKRRSLSYLQLEKMPARLKSISRW